MINAKTSNYISSKLEGRLFPEKGGFGVFAKEPIRKHELLCAWGGHMVSEEDLESLPREIVTHGVQIEEGIYLMPNGEEFEDADYFNHSCNPNAGLSGQVCLVAMRDIAAEEEICFDYAMSDTTDYDEFECQCGSASCRGRITGNDWKRPELQRRYHGYFMPYIQRRIDAMYSNRKMYSKRGAFGRKADYDIKIVSGKKTVYGIKIVSGKKGANGKKPVIMP
ncbi:MAG: SET domain-containing protein [Chloroflexota bacterium]|jgi:hypothetical protein